MAEDYYVTISFDTSALIGHAAGPFSLNFQLNDGSGTKDGNNRVSVTSVSFGRGGSATGTPTVIGGCSGDLEAGVTIKDVELLNSFIQAFVPGDKLTFSVLRDS
jgi:hypothetical protein